MVTKTISSNDAGRDPELGDAPTARLKQVPFYKTTTGIALLSLLGAGVLATCIAVPLCMSGTAEPKGLEPEDFLSDSLHLLDLPEDDRTFLAPAEGELSAFDSVCHLCSTDEAAPPTDPRAEPQQLAKYDWTTVYKHGTDLSSDTRAPNWTAMPGYELNMDQVMQYLQGAPLYRGLQQLTLEDARNGEGQLDYSSIAIHARLLLALRKQDQAAHGFSTTAAIFSEEELDAVAADFASATAVQDLFAEPLSDEEREFMSLSDDELDAVEADFASAGSAFTAVRAAKDARAAAMNARLDALDAAFKSEDGRIAGVEGALGAQYDADAEARTAAESARVARPTLRPPAHNQPLHPVADFDAELDLLERGQRVTDAQTSAKVARRESSVISPLHRQALGNAHAQREWRETDGASYLELNHTQKPTAGKRTSILEPLNTTDLHELLKRTQATKGKVTQRRGSQLNPSFTATGASAKAAQVKAQHAQELATGVE